MALGGVSVGSLWATLHLNTAPFATGLVAAQTGFGKLGGAALGAANVVGTAMTGMALTTAALGAVSLRAAVDWEDAFAGVRKTVDMTEEEYANLARGIRDLTREMPASAREIAGVAEAAGQLGIKNDAILGFTKTMVMMGTSTNLSAQVAAESLARLANITQMPQTQFDRLGATIVDLGNKFATTEAEIVDMGLRIAGAGHQVGLSEDQILSFAAAMSSVGINAEAGGSAISRVFVDMAKDVRAGGKDLETMARVAGVSASEFKRAFEQDAAGGMLMFIEGLGRMKDAGGDVFGTLDELGFNNIRVSDTLLRAAGAGDLFRESLEVGSAAWKENSALTTEAARRYETMQSQWQMLKNALNDIAITIGTALMPHVTKLLDAARGVIDNIIEWMRANEDLVNTIAPIAMAVSGVITAIAGFSMIGKFLAPVAPMFSLIGVAIGPLAALLTPVLGIVGLLAGAFLAFKVAVDNNIAGFGQFAPALDGMMALLGELGGLVGTTIGFFGGLFGPAMQGDVQGMQNVVGEFAGAFQGHFAAIGGHIDSIFGPGTWDNIRTTVGGVMTFLTEDVLPVFASAWDTLTNVVLPAFAEGIGGLVENVMPAIEGAFRWFSENVLPVLSDALGWLARDVIPKVGEVLGWIAETVLPPLGAALGWLLDTVIVPLADFIMGTLVDVVFPALASAFQFIETTVLPPLRDILTFLWHDVLEPLWKNVLEPLAAFLTDVLGAAFSFLTDTVLPPLRDLIGFISGAFDTLLGWLQDVASFIGDTFNGVVEGINDTLGTFNDTLADGKTTGEEWAQSIRDGKAPVRELDDMIREKGIVGLLEFGQASSTMADEFSESGSWVQDILNSISKTFDTVVGEVKKHIDTFAKAVDTQLVRPVQTHIANLQGFLQGLLDKVSDVFDGIVSSIGGAVNAVSTGLQNFFKPLSDGFNSVVGTIRDLWNGFARFLNGLRIDIPRIEVPFVGTFGGGSINPFNLPTFARGGYVPNDLLALVGERGPELVALPGGSRVFPNDQTSSMMAMMGNLNSRQREALIGNLNVYGQTPDDVERQILRVHRRLAVERGL